MLDMDAGHAVLGYDCPVIVQDSRLRTAHIDHRLDGEDQPFLEAEVMLFHVAADIIGHLRRLMHDAADAVAYILFDDGEAGGLGMALHAAGHFGPPAPPG